MTARHRTIAEELLLEHWQVEAVLRLMDEGCTIPFITRYRKEATGSLDEVDITRIRDRNDALAALDERKERILRSLRERELLSDELERAIAGAGTLQVLEDIYLPYRPKRTTRAARARERGLEPLALLLWEQSGHDPVEKAKTFVDSEAGIDDEDAALDGACDIITEWISEDRGIRERLRSLYGSKGIVTSKVKAAKKNDREAQTFRDYFEWGEGITRIPSHRVLALFRGESQGVLTVKIGVPEAEALQLIEHDIVTGLGPDSEEIQSASRNAFKRLLAPAMEKEMRRQLKTEADIEAIDVFSANLKKLLMAPPFGNRRVLAVDPGLRTGCKVVCLDEQGGLLHQEVLYPLNGDSQAREAAARFGELAGHYRPEAIAIGNGTGGRETEQFFRNSVSLPEGVVVSLVNESGASVYSTSEAARREFPDQDATVRGAVSIGRRLMDPLAELVKIDPKSIGVGQYQHDVDQKALRSALDDTVELCVNAVGVAVNTASPELLARVSGLSGKKAEAIVRFRAEKGLFASRQALKAVPGIGPKAFEQCAGFIRIPGGDNPLDAGAVHPENYPIVEAMAADLGCTVRELLDSRALQQQIDPNRYITADVGLPTLQDILEELARPGRDPRSPFAAFAFDPRVRSIDDLAPGMVLPGIVTNVTSFGAFVDVGVHNDGLIHISELADRFVPHPSEVVSPGDRIHVLVLDIDTERKRISFSKKGLNREG
ncbi:MAG: RNA-binding transcriptional accessory protein [Synergistales bacterium]|nr:RNA-binding transcriptional accessory protein [Synergistales bacterium]